MKFAQKLATVANKDLGMRLSDLPDGEIHFLDDLLRQRPIPLIETRMEQIVTRYKERRGRPPQLVIAIISDESDLNGKELKPALTRFSLESASTHMVCIQRSKINSKLSDSTFFKLNLAKINVRLGGHNAYVDGLSAQYAKMMVIGMDVHHPGPGSVNKKSIAAYVGSLDNNMVDYYTCLREHELEREEKLVHLEDVTVELLQAYYQANGSLPQRLVFYRDGIAHSAFGSMGKAEVLNIRRALATIDPSYNPALLFVVVQKRNLARLFLEKHQDGVSSYANVSPGTVVGENEEWFWMVSHQAIQGTAHVPCYHILQNTEGTKPGDANVARLTMTQVEELTLDLCHLHYKCPRSISAPAPVYFADLAAERAKALYNSDGVFYGCQLDGIKSKRLFF